MQTEVPLETASKSSTFDPQFRKAELRPPIPPELPDFRGRLEVPFT